MLAAVGRYILDPMIFDVLKATPVGIGHELQLTDALALAIDVVPLAAFRFAGTRYGCGNHDGLPSASLARQAIVAAQRADPRRKATEAIVVRNARRAMSNGVEEKWAVQASAVRD